MPTVNIFRAGRLLESLVFSDQFFIIHRADTDELFWETGNQQLEYAQIARTQQERGGVIKIWLRHKDISFVLPDWQLRVNGTDCERGFYLDVALHWRTIELGYRDVWFKFLFSPDEIPNEGHLLPRPAKPTRGAEV